MDPHQVMFEGLRTALASASDASAARRDRDRLIGIARAVYRMPLADLEDLTGLSRQHLRTVANRNVPADQEVPF